MRRQLLVLAMLAVSKVAMATGTAGPSDNSGTTIVGEQESSIGLYLAPWQDESANDLDRPPALYDLPLAPLDPEDFALQVEYREQIDAYRHERLFRSR